MLPSTRPQVAVLLLAVTAASVGLAVGEWRRTHPEAADRLERLDRRSGDEGASSGPSRLPSQPATTSSEPLRPAARLATEPSEPRRPAAPAIARARAERSPVDVNRASAPDLRGLPGIGEVLAQRILTVRETEGPFQSVDDLRRVPGLGAAKLERIRALVAVSP